MPILEKQPDIFPACLFSDEFLAEKKSQDHQWWVFATRARAEKKLLNRLQHTETPHYCPLLEKRYRSPSGRIRTSYLPAFTGYVFALATDDQRYQALTTKYIVRNDAVTLVDDFERELKQIQYALQSGVRLVPEAMIEPGQRVEVRSGPFKGYEGVVIRRNGQTRLLISIAFLEKGVSMEIDECQLMAI
jgi:transcription antitermination factor NusG